ncbi:MAG TPA: hypothetical protein VEP89_04070 [Draconibacterium sp.]|nr:hypothetical protein [Draconibacterium sp.]
MEHKISKSALQMRQLIEQAIEDHKITREDYDRILHIATEDGHIDRHEQALLRELQQMIENREVKFVI